ncbi:hypothetical protein HPP92_026771 [Vanilla planifolia]|uniref:pyruvate kinase n=1 Tax=Vanilla planifolia TaxID=51239 RepID=A0A835U5V8_VANPL|nr:hypothetical protein HPP92_026771 [Vanilla planifolia]
MLSSTLLLVDVARKGILKILQPIIMSSLHLQGKLSYTYRFHLSGRKCYRHVYLPVKSRNSKRTSVVCLAKVPEEDEFESDSWKLYAFYDTLNAVNQTFTSNCFQGIDSVRPDQLNCKSNAMPKLMSYLAYDLPELPISCLLSILEKLKAVHLHLLAAEHWNASHLKLCHRSYLVSATNLTHYLALKCLDLHQLNEDLSSSGLNNLEDKNSHVLASIGASMQLLLKLSFHNPDSNESATYLDREGYTAVLKSDDMEDFTMSSMKKRISVHTAALFGECKDKKAGQIMVTVGREAVNNELLITNLLKAGVDAIRINCAHDDSAIWSEIIRIVKYSSQMLEKPCRILMDLAGPKLRTELLRTDSDMVKLSPKKDSNGNVILPAKVWLCCDVGDPPPLLSPDAIICVQKQFLSKIKIGDLVNYVDAKGRKRLLKVLKSSSFVDKHGCIAECFQTSFISLGTKLCVRKKNREYFGLVIKLSANFQFVRLKQGDLLAIFRSSPCNDEIGITALNLKKIACSSDHLFESVKPGEPIAFDDGKIWGTIQEANCNRLTVQITHANRKGSKLGSGKSINIPKSKMHLKGLMPKDLVDLDFIGANADMVGISFVQEVNDVVIIQHELQKRNLQKLGIVLKIETRGGLQGLPSLLFQAMQTSNPLGVMIARGDLMVECGWRQMGDIQEEILSICNAAHIPVIWATQVLESIVKLGYPTRAEITDVHNATRASCIMLNKGDNIVQAVATLHLILSSRHSPNLKMTVNPLFHFHELLQ